jgi:hypothetical protein
VNAKDLEERRYEADLDVEQSLVLLRTCPLRVVSRTVRWFGDEDMLHRYPEIFFMGEWVELCRTDLFDDVCTGEPIQMAPPPPENHYDERVVRRRYIRAMLRAKCGIRLRAGAVSIIDSMTDG